MCFSYTYTHILFLKLFSIKGYYKILTIVPCVCACTHSLSHVRLFVTLDCSPPDSSVHGIFQARIQEWVAIFSSRGISPTQGLNQHLSHLLHCRKNSLPAEPSGKTISASVITQTRHKWYTQTHKEQRNNQCHL